MKILVIHPFDLSTGYLSEIYEDRDWLVIDTNPSSKYLKEQIKLHDRIIMLGHGTEKGLLGFSRYVIDSSLVYLLREKICVCIWCHADKFVTKYGLKGFYTGMIISEEDEAVMYEFEPNKDKIFQSNTLFARSIKNSIDSDNILNEVKTSYYINNNEIVEFNNKNIFNNLKL